jgi:Trk-type K+ transport system membrane component
MAKLSSDKPVFTAMVLALVLIVVIAGAVVTITNPNTLSFHQYVTDVTTLAGAIGLGAGVGRGIEAYGNAQVTKTESPYDTSAPENTPDA